MAKGDDPRKLGELGIIAFRVDDADSVASLDLLFRSVLRAQDSVPAVISVADDHVSQPGGFAVRRDISVASVAQFRSAVRLQDITAPFSATTASNGETSSQARCTSSNTRPVTNNVTIPCARAA